MWVHEDLTQQQNNAVHFVFKILPDDGQVGFFFLNFFWLLLQTGLTDFKELSRQPQQVQELFPELQLPVMSTLNIMLRVSQPSQ